MKDRTLFALVEALEKDPTDDVSVQALADYLEERKASVASVGSLRRLTEVGDGDVLVLGYKPYNMPPASEERQRIADALTEFFRRHNRDVLILITPANWTIRTIRERRAQ